MFARSAVPDSMRPQSLLLLPVLRARRECRPLQTRRLRLERREFSWWGVSV